MMRLSTRATLFISALSALSISSAALAQEETLERKEWQAQSPQSNPIGAFSSAQPEDRPRASEEGSKSASLDGHIHSGKLESFGERASFFDRYYQSGLDAYLNSNFDAAEDKLLNAIRESKKLGGSQQQLIKSRLALADVYVATDRFKPAEELYSAASEPARRTFGSESQEYAQALQGMAEVAFNKKASQKAETLVRQALAIRQKLGPKSRETGQSLILLGRVLGAGGWTEEAHFAFQQGLETLERKPGYKSLDYANALRNAALFYHTFGKRARAGELFEHSYSIKDKAVIFDQPTKLAGNIRYKWEDGSPRAQEFSDADFPLKYLVSNTVRVSATIVDLWELMGVLISITNIGDKKVELGLGTARLTELEEPRKPLPLIEPNTIDNRRRERTMWDLTYNRPWLANIQKTRTFRGFVPPKGHDLYRGPNIFGIYGKWGGTPRILPPEKFLLQRSPEQLEEQAQVLVEEDLVRSRNQSALGLVPVTLEPFESRTGVLYYLNLRKEDVLLTVPVGNAVFEFPFKLVKKRIPH